MRPFPHELDDEIRGHLALAIRERVERGEDPEAARYAALRELGNPLLTREAMQQAWRPRWLEAAIALVADLRIAFRSLRRSPGLAATIAVMLALGIGANAAVFSVVRQVLFLPLVNDDEQRLVYIRQGAPGIGAENMTFSMPEIRDLRSRATTIASFGDFSTIDFTLVGFGEPRVVRAGVVSGAYFQVMGLRPVLGRLVQRSDDGPEAAPVAVLTHRFWTSVLQRDATVIGRVIRLGSRSATVIGVLEPVLPYPADTEVIANVATSPHHLGATMVEERTHRMTELFGRLAPGASVEMARAELQVAYAAMTERHPDTYAPSARFELRVRPLRDALTAPARTVLLLLLAAAFVVFAIACSNVANLILARSVRRERELSVRACLGASRGALRRTLLAESLVLCGTGALLGVLLARPLVSLVASFAARFSVRALDVTVDPSLLWMGAGLAMAAAVVLAFVPRLPSQVAPTGPGASGGLRITAGTNGRLRAFAVAQVALSFVLLAGAGMLLSALVALQTARTGFNLRQVLALDVPLPIESFGQKAIDFYSEAIRRVEELPGVERVAVSNFVPWRDSGTFGPGTPFRVDGFSPVEGEEDPRARMRNVSPGFFAALGVPLLAGRDFSEADRGGGELVVIVSQTLAKRMFPNGEALDRSFWWTDPYFGKTVVRRRIVGVVADVDDESVVPGPALTAYHPFRQLPYAGRLFIHSSTDPYALVPQVTRILRSLSADQPVERAATLEDVRAQVLAPDRLNAFVLSGFALVALLIAVVGVAGVLAFSVSARTREFGVRLACGGAPRQLLTRVLGEGALIAGIGVAAGGVAAYALGHVAASNYAALRLPGAMPLVGAAALLMAAAVVASLLPAARASRVDVVQALRSE